MTATEDANPASTAAATSRYAPLAFATSGETSSPKALRRWRFSGFVPGKRIYAHFRLGGRTRGTYRFGLAKGPCGEDTRRAPGIAVKGRVATGTWVVQVDQQATYSKTAVPRVSAKAPVFNRFRPRATAARAGAARPAASAGAPRFGGVRS